MVHADDDQPNDFDATRRRFLSRTLGVAAVPVAALTGSRLLAQAAPPPPPAGQPPLSAFTVNQRMAAASVCPVTPQAVEGPYYIDKRIIRSDIREGQVGHLLRLRLEILNANRGECLPAPNTAVSIWQANATGYYSGYPDAKPDLVPEWVGRPLPIMDRYPASGHITARANETFLRGIQTADAQGRVEFLTIVPGWYTTRTSHIHVKVFLGAGEIANVQFYFPQVLLEYLHTQEEPYKRRGTGLFTNENDNIRRQSGLTGTQGLLDIHRLEDGTLEGIGRIGLSHI